MTITTRRLRSWYSSLRAVPRYYVKAATADGFHPFSTARALGAALLARYTPDEAYAFGLLKPGANARTDRRFISMARMHAIHYRLNPASWRATLEDKSIFYGICRAAGLPVPRQYGLFMRHSTGWSHSGRFPAGSEAWIRFFARECPDEFVIKPTLGRSGRGVRVLVRQGGHFLENGTRMVTAATLYDELMTRGSFDTFVIQERIRNHQALRKLTGTDGLQTARVHTVIREGGNVDILCAHLKVILGGNFTDNFRSGASGNVIARIDLTTGRLNRAVTHRKGIGFVPVEPGSGVASAVEGFGIPLWDDLRQLLCRTAPVFLPLRHIGWDVAATPEGPVLIEGNYTADAPVATVSMEEFLPALLGT